MIVPLAGEIEQYLWRQERFERLRRTTTLKAGRKLCDLAYANSYDGPAADVIRVIRDCLDRSRQLDLQYTPYGGSTTTRRLIARQLSVTYGRDFGWHDVVLTPGAMAALNMLFRLVRREGEPNEVIVITPCWLDYPLYLANLGMNPVMVPLAEDLQGFDMEAIERSLTSHTRAVVISQPNNPLGTLHSWKQLRELGALLDASVAHPMLISDECHRDFVFEPQLFTSPLEHYDRTCIVYSFGKSLFMQGQRIGYVAVSPHIADHDALAGQLERLCRTMGFCAPTSLMQLAIRDLLTTKPNLDPIKRRRRRMVDGLQSSGYKIIPSHGTFFLYVRSPDDDDFSFAECLADQSVLVLPSSIFHQAGYFRICLTAPDDMIERALPVFAAVRGAAPEELEPALEHASQ
ncbi:MAG TPA: aminotransferase class I/II-fold pyridoxal phosphate-dependent enzyme [Nitrospiraceae bacterium]|nr:aminotransferase class I/II-fold pyridoxal phosphate-dependent enzyme [Nitrospiraceae bacterium]